MPAAYTCNDLGSVIMIHTIGYSREINDMFISSGKPPAVQ
jgi:hypothetical protein